MRVARIAAWRDRVGRGRRELAPTVDNCEIATRHPAGCGGTRLAVVGGAVHGRITAGRKNAILARWLRSPHAEPHGGRLAGEGVGSTAGCVGLLGRDEDYAAFKRVTWKNYLRLPVSFLEKQIDVEI